MLMRGGDQSKVVVIMCRLRNFDYDISVAELSEGSQWQCSKHTGFCIQVLNSDTETIERCFFCGFPHYLEANSVTVPQISPRSLPSRSSLIH